jgi:hypothetical protein
VLVQFKSVSFFSPPAGIVGISCGTISAFLALMLGIFLWIKRRRGQFSPPDATPPSRDEIYLAVRRPPIRTDISDPIPIPTELFVVNENSRL